MEYEKIKDKFGDWANSMKEFIQSEEFDNIFRFLKTESANKKIICPDSKDVFKSFTYCSKDKLRCIVMLMDPYPSMKDGVKIASGIPMDCSNTNIMQPSLTSWWKAIEESYYGSLAVDMDLRNDLSYLLKEEGVMLINSALTTEYMKSGSHKLVWGPFMRNFWKIINEEHRGIPIVLCGAQAQKYEKDINPLLHYILKVEHPVAAAYGQREWNYQDMFQWINRILEANNGYGIRWVRNKGETVLEKEPW